MSPHDPIKLKPCLLCFSRDVAFFLADDTPRAEVHGVKCLRCDLNITRRTQEAAAVEWNRRGKARRTVIDATKEIT